MQNATAIDYGKSKECTGVRVLDSAGTKIKCAGPAWVGAAHALIVVAKSAGSVLTAPTLQHLCQGELLYL